MASGMTVAEGKSWEDRLHNVDTFLAEVPPVRIAAEKCNVQPWVVGAAGSVWMFGFLFWGFTGEILCTALGLLYPMYASFKALEEGQEDEVNQWLTYFTTYAALILAESALYRVLLWVPLYHLLRIVFIVWLFLPSTRGASRVYSWAVAPLLRRYSPRIDSMLAKTAEDFQETLGAAGANEIKNVLRKAAVGGAGQVVHDLGLQDLMAEELTKAANARASPTQPDANGLINRKTASADAPSGHVGSRARVSSPVARAPITPTSGVEHHS